MLHSTPSWRAVMEAELRAVGFAIRRPAIAAGCVVIVVTLVMGIDLIRQGEGIPVLPELGFILALAAPLLPIAVWRGEYRFRHSYLASMPVERARHTFAKIAAGWVWLLAMTAAFLLWMLLLAAATGGDIGVYRGVLISGLHESATVEPAGRFEIPLWQWGSVFGGTTVTYLLGSAVVLGGRLLRRSLAAIVVVCFSIMFIDDEVTDLGRLARRFDMIIMMITEGRYGLETLARGRQGAEDVIPLAGEQVNVWHPANAGVWIVTTLLWLGLSLVSLLPVLRRERAS